MNEYTDYGPARTHPPPGIVDSARIPRFVGPLLASVGPFVDDVGVGHSGGVEFGIPSGGSEHPTLPIVLDAFRDSPSQVGAELPLDEIEREVYPGGDSAGR